MDMALQLSENLKEASMILEQDTDDNPPLSGIDDELDRLSQAAQCTTDPTRSTVHEMYRCSSATQLLNIYVNMLTEMSVRRDNYGGMIEAEVPAQFLHLIGVHLIPLLEAIDARLLEMMDIWTADFDRNHIIFFVVELVVAIVIFIVMMVFVSLSTSMYNMLLTLMRRISPISIVANEKFMEYLMDRSATHSSAAMTTSKSIIHHSSDSLCRRCLVSHLNSCWDRTLQKFSAKKISPRLNSRCH